MNALPLAMVLLLAGTAYAAAADPPHPAAADPKPASALKPAMTTTAKGFVRAAGISDMYEVEAGQVAIKRSSNAAVKDFADHMVAAHTESTQKLKTTLADNHIDVPPPTHLDARHQGMIDALKAAKQPDFDHTYLTQQQAAHQEAESLMKSYAKDGDKDPLKQFAAEMAPVVNEHLAEVKQIQSDMQMASK